jgi:hypothetical protein
MRRQMSYAVRAMPIGPIRRVKSVRIRGTDVFSQPEGDLGVAGEPLQSAADPATPNPEEHMPVDTSLFTQAIEEHLELKRRNAELEPKMPIKRYKQGDPFHNHPLFKSEEQARLEETMDGVPAPVEAESLAWPTDETVEHAGPDSESDENLWSRSRDFDWGD